MVLQVFSSDVFKFMTFLISFKTRLTSTRCFNICLILLVAENIALLKEFNSIVHKLAAAMVTLAIRYTYRFCEGCMNTRFILKYTRFVFTDLVHLKLISN